MSRTTMIPMALLAVTALCCSAALAAGNPLTVCILAGQSHRQGSAHKCTFAALGDDPKTAGLLSEILDRNGNPVVCHNAWITCLTGGRDGDAVLHGKVRVGCGFDGDRIGPEYAFRISMDQARVEAMLEMETKRK